MNRAGSLLVALGLLWVSVSALAQAGQTPSAPAKQELSAPGKRVLEPFDYHGVTLEDGDLKRQFDETRSYYLRIPNDDLLKGFRARAGFPAPGVDLGGWYSSDTFHIFGQILSGPEASAPTSRSLPRRRAAECSTLRTRPSRPSAAVGPRSR